MFLNSRAEFKNYLSKSKKPFMATFYKDVRKKSGILMGSDGNPIGGKWSFDEDNRNKLPKNISIPKFPKINETSHTKKLKPIVEKEFKNHIYSLNYDKLVTHPTEEIKSLIGWLGWNWNDLYLSPHLNNRKVSTRSNVQVRSPINTKSLGGWKNYKEMLRPAMEIITQKETYRDLKY